MENKDSGEKENYVFFWGSNPEDGIVGCLGNWYSAPFVNQDGIEFFHSEGYMMWRKALLFGDQEIADKILVTRNPAAVKRFGRKVKDFKISKWKEEAMQIMVDGLMLKFSQNPELGRYLESTGNAILVEASPYDQLWGIGMSTDDPDRFDQSKWKGTNWLGQALMKTREALRSTHKDSI